MSKDISIVKKEFNQIATNRVFNIPDNLDDRTVYQINSISEWALSWDWARAALVRCAFARERTLFIVIMGLGACRTCKGVGAEG